jgi:predicted signal transduction protein with EAL and GGDEF domain
VAEGVESDEHLAALRELGCDEVQGHLFSAALPASEVPNLVRQVGMGSLRKHDPDARRGRRPRRETRRARPRPPRGR